MAVGEITWVLEGFEKMHPTRQTKLKKAWFLGRQDRLETAPSNLHLLALTFALHINRLHNTSPK